ncbi:sodium:proton antiporter [Herbaspirillum sp. AP02]|uniref:sodium:proton antiporter n=1 Tax=unclassified Herbaspirillum TaxID=2624150 RepID=UPI0015D99432|nr:MULTISPECIES: sodium:proton antiporter [unclassified Herbaspirillum]MBG7618833.1 sodium:proton antiporter [Herbaspirillum sp. AP02]NZD67365.1 sodium:proton antiporter [Herbaspirillum sp. AP21]
MPLNAILLALLGLTLPLSAQAADLDGAGLSLVWALPFAGVLLSIAVLPLLAPSLWHHHFGKIAGAWALALLLPLAATQGLHAALAISVHALVAEYLPFIILLTALFTVAGGICVRGNLHGTPALNTGLLALGTLLASIMGTTGAAMLLIRPLIRANDDRKHSVHVVVFFIFLVANAGGSLTPLGDPPLFLGFLKGVDFFWTARHLLVPMVFLCGALLLIFYLLDRHFYLNREERRPLDPTPDSSLQLEGSVNFLLLAAVVGLVLMSGLWKPGVATELMGAPLEWQNLLRDGALLLVILLSLWLTPGSARAGNEFGWGPMLEVGKLFAAIFLTIAPVIAMLRAGEQGAFAAVVRAVTGPDGRPDDVMYFWMTGLLSSFLDNAPTYLVFFNTASGDARELMGPLASTLAAISAGAVFMGANSYIGNAPNMMVKAIAEERGIRMPSFFGYMAWSVGILVPLFIIMSFLFF